MYIIIRMRKLNRAEIRFLKYLDEHLDDVFNKSKAFKILRDDLGLDSKEAAHLYSVWYFTKGDVDYSEVEYDDDNSLVSFIRKMSSFNSNSDREAYIDAFFDVICWSTAEVNYLNSTSGTYKLLKFK